MIKVLRNICINISDKSFTKLKFAKTNKMSTKKTNFQEWFDDDCRKAKTNVNKKRKLYQEALKNKVTHNESKLRKDDYFQALNEFNAIKRRKARIQWREKKECLETMKMKSPKEFWRKLELKHKGVPFNFKKDELYNYFKKLSGKRENKVGAETLDVNYFVNESDDVFEKDLLDVLNRVISIEEVRKVIKNLKNGKAAGLDKIIPELIKAFDDNMLEVIAPILNNIFDSGNFPEEWALGVIVILYKDGTKSDLNNYRGITLLSMLGKILIGVLNNRLWEVVNKYEILRENQAGFRRGYRTTDHIFTLTTIINHYVNTNKKPLSLCFVDFRKAFDKVDHKILWEKIYYYGAGGKFLNIIKSMYEKVKSCVRSKEGLTNFLNYDRGVRQGCLLSPLLFSLYINYLLQCLDNK